MLTIIIILIFFLETPKTINIDLGKVKIGIKIN